MIYKTLLFCMAILLIINGCSNNNQDEKSNAVNAAPLEMQTTVDSNVIKVYVEQDGKITADGNEISLNDLDSSFSKLQASNGTVYYSRANAKEDPPQESMKVMELIVKYSLSVKLFTDKTFTVPVKLN